MRKLLSIIILSLTCSLAFAGESVNLFRNGDGGYNRFRIPAIIQAANGDVLAFAEARTSGDTGHIEMVMRRSTDGGKTWSPLQVIWKDGENTCGNPAPVLDERTGRLVMVTTWNDGRDPEWHIRTLTSHNTRRVFCFWSDDNGYNWTDAREITSSVKNPEWTWYATGPCHGIQIKKGAHKGRLVIPCNHALPPVEVDGRTVSQTVSHVIYSDDGGETWVLGGTPSVGNESTVAELPNGDLMLNMRVDGVDKEGWSKNANGREVAISHDCGVSFDEAYFDKALTEPICQGTILNYTRKGKLTRRLLFCNPSSTKRNNMWLKLSKDAGRTWAPVFHVAEGPSAYSDIMVFPNGDVGILYETGEKGASDRIDFIRVEKKVVLSANLSDK